LSDLLDGLDDYFRTLRQLKKYYPDGYNYYARVGAPVVPSKSISPTYHHLELAPHWRTKRKRPAIAMAHFHGYDATDKRYHVVFCMLQKVRAREHVQFTNHDMYECALFYKTPGKAKIKVASTCYLSLGPDGEIGILRVESRGWQGDIPTRRWGIPWILKAVAKDNGEKPIAIARAIFHSTAYFSDRVDMGLLVRARKDGLCAAFSIDMLRTPYFFKQRDKTVTVNGRTKPIFHIVRTHKRKTGSFVKTHFRGLRHFDWLGYKVTVSMPGLHHMLQTSWDAEAMDQDDPMIAGKKMIDMREAGEKIAGHLGS
jgi:hypothetical protein